MDKLLSQMKNLTKFTTTILLTGFAFMHVEAQEMASLSTGGYPEAKAITEKPAEKPAAPEVVTPIIHVTIKNTSERSVVFFAGDRKELKTPKVQTCGGLSKNTIDLHTSDVVCLISPEYKPVGCAFLKPETTVIEINSSGNNITSK